MRIPKRASSASTYEESCGWLGCSARATSARIDHALRLSEVDSQIVARDCIAVETPSPPDAAAGLQSSPRRHLCLHFSKMGAYADAEIPVIVRGQGCHVYDSHGQRLLDGLSALVCVNAGHSRGELADAAAAQMRELAYHGTTMGALAVTGPPSLKEAFEPLVPGACHAANTNDLRWPAGRDALWAADAVEQRILAEDAATVAEYCDGVLAAVQDGDQAYADELLRSLDAFLEHNGHWERAAEQALCHRHTLRYRIRRIEQLSGRDLSDPRDRIEFWLALRARELAL